MIALVGLLYDQCLRLVADELTAASQPYVWIDQRRLLPNNFQWAWQDGDISGFYEEVDGRTVKLESITAVYFRLESIDKLPVISGSTRDESMRQYAEGCERFLQWTDISPARIVSRAELSSSNASKPFQLQLIAAAGFATPATIVTNSPAAVRNFCHRYGRVIYKSTSGTRSIVKELAESDIERMDLIKNCPVQFQQLISGLDVRVHVVGNAAYAVAVETPETDYRYGTDPRYAQYSLPSSLEQRCVDLSSSLGLEFAGVDLMITPDNKVYCFEVNPMPGYVGFQLKTGTNIARPLARLLASPLV